VTEELVGGWLSGVFQLRHSQSPRLRLDLVFCYFSCGLATFDLSPGQTAFALVSTTITDPSGSGHVA
jgi:hypothetical protein